VVVAGSLETGAFDSVTAMVFGELYRHQGGWKFRAVGQGWASGLSGLVTDFGISVEDESSVVAQAESLRHLQQLVTFAFADEPWSPTRSDLVGRATRVSDSRLFLDADEKAHLDTRHSVEPRRSDERRQPSAAGS
jgi:TerD domain-containing protein